MALPPSDGHRRDHLELVQAICDLSTALTRAEVLESVCDAALDAAGRALGVSRAAALTLDGGGAVRFAAWRGLSDGYRSAVERHASWAPEGRTPQPVLVGDVSADLETRALLDVLRAEKVAALGSFPLRWGGRVLGALGLYYAEPHYFTADEVRLASAVADQAAVAIARNHADRRLRESEARWQMVVETVDEGVLVLDSEGNVSLANRRFAAMLGYEPQELAGRSFPQLVQGDGAPATHERLQSPYVGPEEVEVGFRRKDGGEAYRAVRVSPLLDADGAHLGAVALVAARPPAVPADNARSQQGPLGASAGSSLTGRGNDEFLSLVSHEMRTPITTIYGNAQVLQRLWDRIDDSDRRTALADIEADAGRLQRLIENMLVLARTDAGRRAGNEPVLLNRLAEAAVKELRQRNPDREVVLDVAPALAPVSAQPAHLALVLRNLLDNAARYSPPDAPVEVTISAAAGHARVCVADSGPGVGPEELELIFEPFYRSGRGDAAPGAGMGLAVCRRLIEAQGGKIWARNREPNGLEVCFVLPLDVTA